jgi:hypothetical protein
LQLPENDELVWDNGTPFPEPCIDRLAPHIGKVWSYLPSPYRCNIQGRIHCNLLRCVA